MTTHLRKTLVLAVLASASACGLEQLFGNTTHDAFERPASAIRGEAPFDVVDAKRFTATDGENELPPFQATFTPGAAGSSFDVRLPSSRYNMILLRFRGGNMELRSLVPVVGEETSVSENLDARAMTEALIVEANLSARGMKLKTLNGEAYLGTRNLIRADFDRSGPTQDLLRMVERFLPKYDPLGSVTDPDFFGSPVLLPSFKVKTSPISAGFLSRNAFDYDGDGAVENDSKDFDEKLEAAAKLYAPEGCPDPANIRVVFEVDFREGGKNGACGTSDRFKWATDKPGKSMYFVGWVHTESAIQDPAVNTRLGASTPNQLPMYDDGTNGDATAGDGVYTIAFTLPKGSPGNRLRIGYKYTWGTRGAVWTGSEEWPGNSRILEVVDTNGDEFVYRRDVFGDEATNKDRSNLNPSGTGSITWTTDLHGCGQAEAYENKYDNATCSCAPVPTPEAIGPLTVACTSP